jgi:Trk K+ transport system NAD-binding subunit
MRVVSLLPSGTEILYGLGIEPVAVSHECDFPPAAREKPVVNQSRVDPTASATTINEQVQRAEQEHASVYELRDDVLEAANIEAARSVLLAIPDDNETEFTTLVVRDISPETEVIARVEETESVQKMYRAGADYALSLETISGRMIAATVLEEDIISLDTKVDIIRTRASELEGQTLGDVDFREKTGVTVVGIERNGDVLTDLGPETRIEAGDELIVAGTDEGTNRFTDRYC